MQLIPSLLASTMAPLGQTAFNPGRLLSSQWARPLARSITDQPRRVGCAAVGSLTHTQKILARRSFHTIGRTSSSVSAAAETVRMPAAAKTASSSSSLVPITIDGQTFAFSALLLRDACQCSACVHETSKQRLFSHFDIPADLRARSVEVDHASGTVSIKWANDVYGFDAEHTTTLTLSALKNLARSGAASGYPVEMLERQVLWPLDSLRMPDFDYDEYMRDDKTLYKLIRQLRVHGLAFIVNSPQDEDSALAIATRIGPIKNTLYGATFDVRSVPRPVNAAFTSSDLGFHADLLYFQQPPHIQLLHCIQSASTGGSSVFSDGHKASVDLFHADFDAFNTLATTPINYHYTHPQDNVYHMTKPVIEMRPLCVGNAVYEYIQDYIEAHRRRGAKWTDQMLVDCLDKCNWSPPFSAPFSLDEVSAQAAEQAGSDALAVLNAKVERWHDAAVKFNGLLQRPENLLERKMEPGMCVLFDNTRILHSRRAFDKADVGKPRWLRGTYIDKDPFLSRMRVLQNQFGR